MSTISRSAPAPETRRWSGFGTLFMTDVWERFGFYAMTAVLSLYAAAPVASGGLGWQVADAAALFAIWLALTFMFSLPGGWLADRVLGARRTLMAGGLLVICGYLVVILTEPHVGLIGLAIVTVGTGLYKPSHQTMFNLMVEGRARRESGISLLYVGIQLSALVAPLVAGYLGERVDWRLAFASAAVTMLIGLVTLVLAAGRFGDTGLTPPRPIDSAAGKRLLRRGGVYAAAAGVVLVTLGATGSLSPSTLLPLIGLLTLAVPVITYVKLYRDPGLGAADRKRLLTFLWVFAGWTLFWMLVGQGGSVLNLFGLHSTDRELFGFEVPASWLQSATPLFILLLGPVFAWLLPRMGRRSVSASVHKLTIGLLVAGGSFLVMTVASVLSADGTKVSPLWLLIVYFAHACGELIIAAVGVASVADVLPRPYMSQMIGMLWLFAALGGGVGSQVVRLSTVVPEPVYYTVLGVLVIATGFVLASRRTAIATALSKQDARRDDQ
ncbi:peptide MFS transporter [Kibdelosporangium phytohabitans]|uniref:Peptide permease n=1 Tax=Kibdelosporangium phytohabitans TaxID=860235 RepID=A0A0N7F4A7_9PSEU|nr:peptide MFS transporter [Kibdelosporangium phytohabitans]ALG10903.1 peptide permease [Kibdelosporangium phytohabitans]MBE1462094.1 POT family proton-dependent oligopeptide transporter [Kibdelosporangium phytohabitans]